MRIHLLFNILFHCGLSQATEYSPLRYTVGLAVHPFCVWQFASANPALPAQPSPSHPRLVTTSLISASVSLFQFHLCPLLDSACKWYHMAFVFLFLTYCRRRDRLPTLIILGFSCGSAGKESACNVGDLGLIPGLGRSPGEGKGYPLQYSGLENSMDCIDHGVTKSRTRLSNFHFHVSLSLIQYDGL